MLIKGYVISVFLRDEHCPPHVQSRGKEWDARFRFSFLDGDVELWDVDPERSRPPIRFLNEIREALLQRHYLARARPGHEPGGVAQRSQKQRRQNRGRPSQ